MRALLFIFLLFKFNFLFGQEVYLTYPDTIGILNNCPDKKTRQEIILATNTNNEIKVFNIRTNFKVNNLVSNGFIVNPFDTFLFSYDKPLQLELLLYNLEHNDFSQDDFWLSFETEINNYKQNKIIFLAKTLLLTLEDLSNFDTIFIDKTKNCLDTFNILFPYGGSVSGIRLINLDDEIEVKVKEIDYWIFGDRKIIFYPNDVGFFEGHYGSCNYAYKVKLKIINAP